MPPGGLSYDIGNVHTNLAKFGHVVSELCEWTDKQTNRTDSQTDRQTDRQTYSS